MNFKIEVHYTWNLYSHYANGFLSIIVLLGNVTRFDK